MTLYLSGMRTFTRVSLRRSVNVVISSPARRREFAPLNLEGRRGILGRARAKLQSRFRRTCGIGQHGARVGIGKPLLTCAQSPPSRSRHLLTSREPSAK